ncbi:bacillithiol biosynthesis deacetylase BshB1 [Salipaludibacillus daqingensis]|uniref:bacillithiol biosynthesis deacetylase BshB1 n=1 Tax=Salipaludibacillus daqingensis TaxID=3041001 RepID=UPI0024771FFF|nr:bacillithiol biosynthesis deacetylase BshB1 [Salipaludibacillus daqingensis]
MTKERQLDVLAVGAHPDDVEIGMGGTIAKYQKEGKKILIVHLTEAELSSNGTVDNRQKEAQKACETLGLPDPIQFKFADRKLLEHRQEAIDALVKIIRKYRPKLVFAPYHQDRHPDHGHCGELVKEAFFSAGIKKYMQDESNEYYRPDNLYFYQINGMSKPDFLVDISLSFEMKYKALACFKSQFSSREGQILTPLNNGYIDNLKARDQLLGGEAGVRFAEGFFSEKPILIHDLLGDEQ